MIQNIEIETSELISKPKFFGTSNIGIPKFDTGLWRVALSLTVIFLDAPSVSASNLLFSVGSGMGHEEAWTWQSLTWLPMSTIAESGPIFRIIFNAEARSYDTELPKNRDARIEVREIGADVEAGWQYANNRMRAAALVGVSWSDHDLFPADPNSPLTHNMIAAKFSTEGQFDFDESRGVFWYGNYRTGSPEWYAAIKPYFHFANGLKVGPEISAGAGENYLHIRSGFFVDGYEFSLPWLGTYWLGGSAGALSDVEHLNFEAYGSIHFTRAFGGP
jgi:hypothetical protein